MKRIYYYIINNIIISFILLPGAANAGIIKGRVYNSKTNEGVPFATVQIWGTTIGAVTDFDGNFLFYRIKTGICRTQGFISRI